MKRQFNSLIFLALYSLGAFLCLAPEARAQEPNTPRQADTPKASSANILNLGEVVRMADDRYPLIAAALSDVEAAEGERTAAAGGFDPLWRASGTVAPMGGYQNFRADTFVEQATPVWGLSLFAGYRISSEKDSFPVYDQKLATNQLGEVRAGIRIPVLRDGPIDRRRAQVRRSELGVEIAKLSVTQQRLEIIRLASHRYWDWVAAGRRLAIVKDWLQLAQQRDADIATRAKSGDIAAIDRTENQRTILQRKAAVVAFERMLVEATQELSLFSRDEQGVIVPIDNSRLPSAIPEASADALMNDKAAERSALENRPEIPRLKAQQDQALVERDWARNQMLPAVDVVLLGSKDFGPGDPKWDKPAFEASLFIDIPLLARVAKGRAQAAGGLLGRLEQQERLTRDRIVADVRNAAVAVRTALERAKLSREEFSVAAALEKAEFEKFFAGESTLLVVNLREQATAEAALRLVDALTDVHKSIASYRAATAQGLRPIP